MKELLTGDEAIARGAYEAGAKYASAYPGTPSTEILENTASYKDEILAEWGVNEKVAFEAAYGASLAGVRSFVAMKHVGLNVAADPFFTSSYIGVNGGFVVITADEPGHHSSQNEQDNRNYAKAAKVPMLEPSNSMESKDMTKYAFELSEDYNTPVLIRPTTRICHSKGIVPLDKRQTIETKPYIKDVNKHIPVPAMVTGMRNNVEDRTRKLQTLSNESSLNYFIWNNPKVGVISSGISFYHAREVFGDSVSYLKIGFSWPLPEEKIIEFSQNVEKIYVIEEDDPYIEEAVKSLGIDCLGKDIFPNMGEMLPEVIRKSVDCKCNEPINYDHDKIVPRPPTFCAGCPHRGIFLELGKQNDLIISGDIGCYTLGFAEPYSAMDLSLCMGAAFSMGHGFQQALDFNARENERKKRIVSILGDSTFFHTGINSLLNCAYNGSKTINIILDNRITGMTGHQENPGSGYTLQGKKTNDIDWEHLIASIGIKNIKIINPNNLDEVRETLKWAKDLDETSVIITRWPCVLKRFSIEDNQEFGAVFKNKCIIDKSKCIGCKMCIKAGCPAISFDSSDKKAFIDKDMCVGCTVCSQMCAVDAIQKEEK